MTDPANINRREFGQQAGAFAAMAFAANVLPSGSRGGLERPALAGIGTGGKGRSDIQNSKESGFNIAALVDVVDSTKLTSAKGRMKSMGQTRRAFSDARFFTDYREMLDAMGDKIDGVTVSTPDHHHFHASVLAMLAGKHVYCQKPLTHGIWEARTIAEVARQTGVKTQMGNQAHAMDHMRRCVELIRGGVIGKVKEVHAWTNRPIWPQGFDQLPAKADAPSGLDWKQWIGPAPAVPFSPQIAPFKWRGWWNYGTGALGDMACHIMDLGYWATLPGAPTSVMATQFGATKLSPPINSKVAWEFAPSQFTSDAGFKYLWYDGFVDAHFDTKTWALVKESEDYNHPGPDLLEGLSFKKFGSVVVGENGKLFFNRNKKDWVLKTDYNIDGFDWPKKSLPRATDQNNHTEWLDAIEGRIEQSESNFSLAGPMTEAILLGVIAQRVPDTKLEWDTERMEFVGRPELKKYVRREYQNGWSSPV